MLNIVIFGATGAIGESAFSLIRKHRKELRVVGATCDTNYKKLKKLQLEFKIKKIGFNIKAQKKSNGKKKLNIKNENEIVNLKNFHKLITKDVDIIIFAITGLNALDLSLKIAKSGKICGLANKECIYAVSYLKDHAFVTTKCKVSNNIFNSLKN